MERIRNVFYVTLNELTEEFIKETILHQEDPETAEAYGDKYGITTKYNIIAVSDDGIENEKDKVFLNGFCDVYTAGLWRYCGYDFRVTYFNPYREETVKDAVEILRCIANDVFASYRICRYAGEVIAHIIDSKTKAISCYSIEDTKREHKIQIGTVINDPFDQNMRCIIREDNNASPLVRLIQGNQLYLFKEPYGVVRARELEQHIYMDEFMATHGTGE